MIKDDLQYISLDDWQLVRVSGEDNEKYLQGQLTNDLTLLTNENTLFAAHCDAKGKMWSNLILFKRHNDIYYIVRKSVAEKQITELKKYMIFSKTTIELVNDLTMVGSADKKAQQYLPTALRDQTCYYEDDVTYLKLALPYDRFIIITPTPINFDLQPSQKWLSLDLEAGYPIIDIENTNCYLPQACNLQLINAISFNKGCYCGQEMVARAEYRGINKRALYLLKGSANCLPTIGDTLEYQIGSNWREGGQILAAVKLDDYAIYVQVVLNNDMDINTTFKIKNDPNSQLAFVTSTNEHNQGI